jgi:hypothetical protein
MFERDLTRERKKNASDILLIHSGDIRILRLMQAVDQLGHSLLSKTGIEPNEKPNKRQN